MSEQRRPVRDLRDGDLIDLLDLGKDYPLDETVRDFAQYELAQVIAEGDGGSPFIQESADCWVLCTSQGAFGVSPDWLFLVRGRASGS